MSSEYIIYSIRLTGWFARGGNLISDWKKAKRYQKDDALEICHHLKDHQGLVCFPVSVDDIEALLKDESDD